MAKKKEKPKAEAKGADAKKGKWVPPWAAKADKAKAKKGKK